MDEKAHETSRKKISKWWLLLAAVVVLIVAHAIWTAMERHALSARVDELRRMGQPVLPEDFATTQPTDPANDANADFVAAIGLLRDDTDAWKALDDAPDLAPPLTDKERQMIQAVIDESGPAMARWDAAAGKTGMQWQVDLSSPVLDKLFPPSFRKGRSLANLNIFAALLEHEKGNDAAAVNRIDRVLQLSRVFGHHPSLIGGLMSRAMGQMAAFRLMELAPDLKIGASASALSPESARRLIAELLDDRAYDARAVRSFYAERMMQQDTMRCLDQSIPFTNTTAPADPRFVAVVRPLMYADARFMLNYMTIVAPLANEKDWPAASAKFPPREVKSLLHLYSSLLLAAMDRAMETHFRERTDRHLAAVVLALRWYAVDHDGQFPKELADLVPKYLAAVPLDPMAPGQRPLQYKADTKDPIVFSVGPDGADDGGDESAMNKNDLSPTEWTRKDRVAHLVRQPRPKPSEEQEP